MLSLLGRGAGGPVPIRGGFAPAWGAPTQGLTAESDDLSRDQGRPMETMLSELVLAALLLAVVVLSGRV